MAAKSFSGFPIELLHFLHELDANNHREWFNANKSRYERDLLEPALRFIEAMQEPLKKISPHFCAIAKRTGGSLMRIYRDTRFSHEKTPYKTNVGIQFRHEQGKDVHAPGFYFHIEPEQSFIGAGIWHPENQVLSLIRKQIDVRPDRWKKICRAKAFRSRFELAGDSLKRPPQGYPADHPLIEDLRRKDHIAVAEIQTDDLFSKNIVRKTADCFRASASYVEFLCQALQLKF